MHDDVRLVFADAAPDGLGIGDVDLGVRGREHVVERVLQVAADEPRAAAEPHPHIFTGLPSVSDCHAASPITSGARASGPETGVGPPVCTACTNASHSRT